jgi:hypothetical protein
MFYAASHAFLFAATLIVMLIEAHQRAGHAQPARAGQIAIEYVAPTDEQHRPIYERLRRERWLEQMQLVLQRYRLPRTVTVRLAGCDGSVDAWYVNRKVTVCYEYLRVVQRRIEADRLPPWVTAEQALAGAFVDAVFHEFAHGLIELRQLPVLGREEDAADQMSAYTMLSLGGAQSEGVVKGTAHVYLSWMEFFAKRPQSALSTGARAGEARPHPTAAQRLYNLVCIAYGARPAVFETLATAIDLPASRKEDCETEHDQIEHAWRTLVGPLVDPTRDAAARQAFRFFTEMR